jgi:cytochrome c peroxidase
MVLKPIVSHVEMGMSDGNAMVDHIKNLPYYPDLFQKAYGTTTVDVTKISQALSFFVMSIHSTTSKFDQSQVGQATLSGIEMQGKSLFFNKYNCNVCHQTDFSSPIGYGLPTGENVRFVNIGLDLNYADNGRADFTNNPADVGKFKIPNLRNVALTAPYMHDGRFATLDQVLEHYSHGMVNHPNLDIKLKDANGNAMQMNISDQEKTAIIAFLNTLTDYAMITDPKFSDPFKVR